MIGKSIFVWQIPACMGGDVNSIAAALSLAGFESAIIHCETLAGWRSDGRPALAEALRGRGVMPIGGAAVYGANPTKEGEQAAALCNDYNLPAFVFDAEGAFDAVPHPDSAAVKLLQTFRKNSDAKAGWCWWAFYQSSTGKYTYHPKSILWAAMAKNYGDADFGIPMAYWSWGDSAKSAVKYLDISFSQWRKITDKPICPAGRAYIGDGGTPTPEAIEAFEQRARELGAAGVTWWSLQHALDSAHLPLVWPALTRLQPFAVVTPPPPEPELTLEQRVERLETEARAQGWKL